jgi:methyl-accepting chemotaxis protein
MRIAAGFGIAGLIFIAVGFVSHQSTTRLIQAEDLNRHTYEVLAARDDVSSSLKDAANALRNYLLLGDERQRERMSTALKTATQSLGELRALVSDNPAQVRRVDRMSELTRDYAVLATEIAGVRAAKGLPAATQALAGDVNRELGDAMRAVTQEVQREEEGLLKQRTDAARLQAQRAQMSILWGTAAALLVAALSGWLIARSVSRPLRELTGAAERIAHGDLDVQVPTSPRKDEIAALSVAFGRMVQSLRSTGRTASLIASGDLRAAVQSQSEADVLGQSIARMSEDLRQQVGALAEASAVLGSVVNETLAATIQLTSNASEAATAMSETTTTAEELRQTAQLASQKARQVSDDAHRMVEVSRGGTRSADDAAAGMARIRLQMDAIATSMGRLSEQSQAIAQIISTVEDIASQSNLLAVNAAIEAAKAGDQGKGFAVVAQEIRSLAEQSRQATAQVRALLGDVQKATGAAVMATEEGGKAVEAGVRQTELAGASIRALAGNIQEAAQAMTQIAASSQQQLAGVDQVVSAMDSIRESGNQNVASARQLETGARSLGEVGARIQQLVARYKV